MRIIRRVATTSVDCLVIGHGITGLFAASWLSSRGMSVAVVGDRSTSTALSTGCLTTWSDPGDPHTDDISLEALAGVYPYSLVGDELIPMLTEVVSHLISRLGAAGIDYQGGFLSRRRLISNIGSVYTCSLAPGYTLAGGIDGIMERKVAVLGLLGHSDLDPDLFHSMLPDQVASHIRPYWMQLTSLADRPSFLASEVDSISSEGGVVEELSDALAELPHDIVGLPPLFGLGNWHKMREIERTSGRRLFEVVTPLSLPGVRLQEALEIALVKDGGRLLRGWRAVNVEMSCREAVSVSLRSKGGERAVEFSHLILATGDLIGGGLAYDREVRDQFSTFSVSPVRNVVDLMEVSSSGMVADQDMRLTIGSGDRALNVYGAGSVLSGLSYPSGVGMPACLLTGLIASRSVRGV